MPEPKVRHILSIRNDVVDERLIKEAWGSTSDILLAHVDCGIQALDYLRGSGQQLPNLILLAWRFQENQLTAIETLIELKADARLRPIPVIVLAGVLSPYSVEDLYMNHAACVIELSDSFDELAQNLRSVKDLWVKGAALPYSRPAPTVDQILLTDREKEILRLTADDLVVKEIAERLHISSRTVEFHRESIKRRIGVQGTAGMIRYGIRIGLVKP